MIEIWTDGSCLVNPGGAGGWAFAIVEDGEVCYEESGGSPSTTNNIMEMTAVIKAMRYMRTRLPGVSFEIVSDSEYVVKGINEWAPRWKANGWRKGGPRGERPKNLEIWQEMLHLFNPTKMTVRWVKGHRGEGQNELVDHLAGTAAKAFEHRAVEDPADMPLPS